jgi:hypothetical protein
MKPERVGNLYVHFYFNGKDIDISFSEHKYVEGIGPKVVTYLVQASKLYLEHAN